MNVTTNSAANPANPAALWAADNDEAVIKEHCEKVFLFTKFENLHLAQAVQSKMRVGDALPNPLPADKIKKIPRDFVLLKTSKQMTDTELSRRHQKWISVLDFRDEAAHGTDHDSPWLGQQKDFGEVLDTMRELIYKVAGPIIDSHLATEFQKKYPGFMFSNNRKVFTMNDFSDWIHTYNPTDKGAIQLDDARAMVHFVIYAIWGKSNFWANRGERQILEMFGWDYDGGRLTNGTVMKRSTRTGFIKTLAVKKMDMERNKVNDAWERCFKERFYARDLFKAVDPNLPPRKDGKVRTDKSHLRKYVIRCNKLEHKFDGSYLLCEGHPDRAKIDLAESKEHVDGKTKIFKEQEEKMQKEELIRQVTDNILKRNFSDFLKEDGKLDAGKLGIFSKLVVAKGKCAIPDSINVTTTRNFAPPSHLRRKKCRIEPSVSTAVSESDSSVVTGSSSSAGISEVDAFDGKQLDNEAVANELAKSPLGFKFPEEDRREEFDAMSTLVVEGPKSPPAKSKPNQDVERTSRASPSKWRMPSLPDGMICDALQHDDPNKYGHYESHYYSSSVLKKWPHVPKECVRCKIKFTWGRQKKIGNEQVYKLSQVNVVNACQGCFGEVSQPSMRCNRAFCNACYSIACAAHSGNITSV